VNHGREVKEGVTQISWSGGSLPDAHYDEFVFVGQVDASVASAGVVYFPVVQTCANGENRWVEVPVAGSQARLAAPAPTLRILASATSTPAVAQAGSLSIAQPWTRATPGGARVAGGYLTVTNTGSTPDRLTGGSAAFAERVEIHEMATANGVMTMRALGNGLTIAPGQTVALKPGGLHVMFMGLRSPLLEGQSVKVTLEFEKAGKVELMLPVKAASGAAGHTTHGG
jgi:copper(I)-binding protein